MIKKRFKEKYGSIEPYLAMKLEVIIIVALLVSIAGAMVNYYLHFIQALTLTVMVFTFYKIKKKYPEKILKYLAIFVVLYVSAVAAPVFLTGFAVPMTPAGINKLLVILIGVLVLFIGLRVVTSKKGVRAKVILSNEDIAVIQPEYDLISGVKPSKYVVDNKGAEKGDKVVVELSRTPFKKSKPKKISEVVK